MKLRTLEQLNGLRYCIHAHGCFDLLHIGHIRHLRRAAEIRPDLPLVVTITADRWITKGDGRPAFEANIRAESLAALGCVAYVAIIDHATAFPAIEAIQPRIFVKGEEYRDKDGVTAQERELVTFYGGEVHYLPDDGKAYSSTDILTGEYLKRRAA